MLKKKTSIAVPAPTALHGFVIVHYMSLLDACAALGDQNGVRIAGQLRTALRRSPVLTRSTLRLAEQVKDLLHLEHVHDFGREEAACFAELHPADPQVCAICLTADRFADALHKARLQTARQCLDRAA